MLIGIHVTASSKQERVEKVSDLRYEIAVREPAEKGRANKRVLELMRTRYPSMIIRIVSGHRSRSKIISLEIKS